MNSKLRINADNVSHCTTEGERMVNNKSLNINACRKARRQAGPKAQSGLLRFWS